MEPSPALQAARDIKAICFIDQDQGRGDETRTWVTLDEDLAAERIEDVLEPYKAALGEVERALRVISSCVYIDNKEVGCEPINISCTAENALATIAKLKKE